MFFLFNRIVLGGCRWDNFFGMFMCGEGFGWRFEFMFRFIWEMNVFRMLWEVVWLCFIWLICFFVLFVIFMLLESCNVFFLKVLCLREVNFGDKSNFV